MMWCWVERSKVKVIQRGFELYECLLVSFIIALNAAQVQSRTQNKKQTKQLYIDVTWLL